MPSWLYRLLHKWGIIISPSLAFKHAASGTASKRERELVGESARNLGRMLGESDATDEIDELLEMQGDFNHTGWDR